MKWRSWVGGLLLVFAGAALGVATEHLIILHHRHATGSTQTILSTLDGVLDLSKAQHDSIASVLNRHQQEVDSAWKMIHRQLGTSMDSVHQEVGKILTLEQNRRFRDWLRSQHLHVH